MATTTSALRRADAAGKRPAKGKSSAEPSSGNSAARKSQTLASKAYQRLRSEIIHAEFPRGQKLRTQELCERYGMGLSPIREALNRLSSDGLVDQSDQRGFSLAPFSTEHLRELTDTRCWLNELALRKSFENGGREWEESVVLSYYRMSRLSRYLPGGKNADNPAWEEAHRHFHSALISACNSRWLMRFCEQLFDAADCYRHFSRTSTAKRALRKNEHLEIMEAVIARDVEKAVDLLVNQFKRTERLVRERLAG